MAGDSGMGLFPRPARRLLGQALLLPITDFPMLARAFWPALIPIGISFAGEPTAVRLGGWVSFVFSACLLILMFILLSRGLVAWHRWCILGERPSLTDPQIGSRNANYLMCWIGVGIRFAVLYVAIVVPIVFVPMFAIGIEAWSQTVVFQFAAVVIAYVLLAVVFARAFGVTALQLVLIAVDAKQRSDRPVDDALVQPWLWQVVAVGLLVGESASGAGDLISASGATSSAIADGLIGSLALILGFVNFATVLSVYHRDYVHEHRPA